MQQGQNHPVGQTVVIKVAAFREFAATLAGQVVEQLCQEFEREVHVIHAELWQYRTELERVAELLGKQLGHTKQLHAMLEATNDVHSSMVAQMEGLKKQEPDSTVIHDLVEQMAGQHTQVMQSQLSGMSAAYQVAGEHMQKSKDLQQQSITAEHEFNRIIQLLQQPLIPGQMPQATMAMIPRVGPTPMAPMQGIKTSGTFNSTPPMRQSPPGSPVRLTPGTVAYNGGSSPVKPPTYNQAASFA
jgi:hypothetical protein